MHQSHEAQESRPSVPASPRELLALQRVSGGDRKHEQRPRLSKVEQVLELIEQLGLSPWESQQIGLSQVNALRSHHEAVLTEIQADAPGQPSQVACWAIDTDRLQHCHRLLESITLI